MDTDSGAQLKYGQSKQRVLQMRNNEITKRSGFDFDRAIGNIDWSINVKWEKDIKKPLTVIRGKGPELG